MVYNLHLESKGTGELRLEQLEEVPTTPGVIRRKLLLLSPVTSIRLPLARGLAPRLRQAGFRSAFGDRRIRTHVLIGALDWVFVRGSIQCDHGQVLRVPGSDHFPIAVDVRL